MASNAHPQTRLANPSTSTGTSTPTSGSQTTTSTPSQQPSATLRLRGAPRSTSSGSRVQWASSVIDNEGMGKKSSKVCCIYHRPHEPGDSDSEESSSSDSGEDSDGGEDLSRARRAGDRRRRNGGRRHVGGADDDGDAKERKPSPNAYERQPKYKGKGKEKQPKE